MRSDDRVDRSSSVLARGLVHRWYALEGRRIESDVAALLLSTTSAASLGIYSLIRQELNAVLVVVLILFALVQFVFARYMLRVLANDRPQLG